MNDCKKKTSQSGFWINMDWHCIGKVHKNRKKYVRYLDGLVFLFMLHYILFSKQGSATITAFIGHIRSAKYLEKCLGYILSGGKVICLFTHKELAEKAMFVSFSTKNEAEIHMVDEINWRIKSNTKERKEKYNSCSISHCCRLTDDWSVCEERMFVEWKERRKKRRCNLAHKWIRKIRRRWLQGERLKGKERAWQISVAAGHDKASTWGGIRRGF